MKSSKNYLALTAMMLGASNVACTPTYIPHSEKRAAFESVQHEPYAAFIEGIQPLSGFTMKNLSDCLSQFGITAEATSGNNRTHLALIESAYEHGQKIAIAGFSLGEPEAVSLARKCDRHNIPVDDLFLIDGVNTQSIPPNVKRVIDIRGFSPAYIFRRHGRYTQSDLQNPNTIIEYHNVVGKHLDVPGNAQSIILESILER